MDKEENGRYRKKWLVPAGIFLVAALIAGGCWFRQVKNADRVQDEREEITGQVNSLSAETVAEEAFPKEETEETEERRLWENYTMDEKRLAYYDTYGIEIPTKNLDFKELQTDVNEDIYAWIFVPGTDVDDPVVQSPVEDDFYLTHNLDGSKGYPGGIYTEHTYNTKDFSDRMTVIYGHNMRNGKGFASLHNFEDKKIFDENRFFYIYLPDDILVYEIFASYEASSNHIIAGHEWDDESWVEYLTDTLSMEGKKDQAIGEFAFTPGSKVVTLSTCIRNAPNKRYLIQGVLLDEVRKAD